MRKPTSLNCAVFAVAIGLALVAPATAAQAAVPKVNFDVASGSSDPSASTSLIISASGTVATTLPELLGAHLPAGLLFAHADSVAGVPASPVEPRPHNGDVVGQDVESGNVGCLGQQTLTGAFVWNEPFVQPMLANQVAELQMNNLFFHIVQSPADPFSPRPTTTLSSKTSCNRARTRSA